MEEPKRYSTVGTLDGAQHSVSVVINLKRDIWTIEGGTGVAASYSQ